MKKQSLPILILIAAFLCLNCQTENPQETSANYQGLMYGFVLNGNLDDHTTGAAIDLREGMNNDTLYVFDFLNNQSQGTQKIILSEEDVVYFAKTINSTIVDRVKNVPSNSTGVKDGTKVNLYERSANFHVNVDIQIINDIKTELPSLDSLIKRIQAKGARLNY
jgi:hypothetical protein